MPSSLFPLDRLSRRSRRVLNRFAGALGGLALVCSLSSAVAALPNCVVHADGECRAERAPQPPTEPGDPPTPADHPPEPAQPEAPAALQPEPGALPGPESSGQELPSAPEEAPETPTPVSLERVRPGYPRLTHQGQIQFQLDDGTLGAPRASSPFPASGGIGPFPADSRIFVRRFRPAFQLAMSPDFDLQTEFNIDPQTQRIQILDVRFNYDLSEHTYLSAGRYKVPLGWEGLRSSRSTNTIERSDMTLALYPERDVGFSVTHREPHLGLFTLGGFLGQPRSNGGTNDHLDVIGRALFHVSDSLKVGVSGQVGTFRPTGQETDLSVRRVGTEVQYSSGRLKLEGEAMYSDGFNVYAGDLARAFGYYAAVIYELSAPLDLVLHYDRFDPDLDAVDTTRPSNGANARDRKVIGLNYYIDRDLMHRIMLNYEFKQDLEGPGLYTNGFRLRYQLAW